LTVNVTDFVTPFRDALTVAVCVLVTAPAVALKLAEVEPACTDTLAGTLTAGFVEESATGVVLAAAAARVTEQGVDKPVLKVVGLH
jgi:hypothetical protein